MKAKIIIMMYSGLLAGSVAVSAQTYAPLPADVAATSTNAATPDAGAGVAAANSAAASTNAPAVVADRVRETLED